MAAPFRRRSRWPRRRIASIRRLRAPAIVVPISRHWPKTSRGGASIWTGLPAHELRVPIVSASPLARGGLAAMLEGMVGVKAVGSTGMAEAASIAGQLLPDVVLLDVGDGELEELDAIARLAAAQPGLPIVAVAGEQGALAQALAFGASALLPVAVDP